MVIVHAFEPGSWNESAPGAPWGGQSTISEACRDLMLAQKGLYDQPIHFKARRLHFELPQHSDRPGIKEPPRSATLRRMPQWPSPTFDSSGYKWLQMAKASDPIPPLPSARGRLEGGGEVLRGLGRSEPADKQSKRPGVRRAWGSGDEVGSQTNSANSPHSAHLRYGAALQQKGCGSQRSSEQRSEVSQPDAVTSRPPSQPSQSPSATSEASRQTRESQHSRGSQRSQKSQRSQGSRTGSKVRSDSKAARRAKEVESPPLELIPPFVITNQANKKDK